MEKRISATRAVREFSEVLNTIRFKNAHYIIERGGKPVAAMNPVPEQSDQMTLGELKRLLEQLPRLGEELDDFVSDLEWISGNQPIVPTGDPWA